MESSDSAVRKKKLCEITRKIGGEQREREKEREKGEKPFLFRHGQTRKHARIKYQHKRR